LVAYPRDSTYYLGKAQENVNTWSFKGTGLKTQPLFMLIKKKKKKKRILFTILHLSTFHGGEYKTKLILFIYFHE
jgi:hypothetical protein